MPVHYPKPIQQHPASFYDSVAVWNTNFSFEGTERITWNIETRTSGERLAQTHFVIDMDDTRLHTWKKYPQFLTLLRQLNEYGIELAGYAKGVSHIKTWVPNRKDVPSLRAWYKPDDLAADELLSWPDSSGRDLTATRASGGPTVTAGALNGYPTVGFGASLQTASTDRLHGADAAIFVVFRNPTATGEVLMGQYTGAQRTAFVHPRWTDGNLYVDVGDIGQGARATYPNSPFVGADWHIMSIIRRPTQAQVWNNGTSLGPKTIGSVVPADKQPFVIGDSYSGDIAEIIICNDGLTVELREKIEGYLAWKYALTGSLPNAHPYKEVAP